MKTLHYHDCREVKDGDYIKEIKHTNLLHEYDEVIYMVGLNEERLYDSYGEDYNFPKSFDNYMLVERMEEYYINETINYINMFLKNHNQNDEFEIYKNLVIRKLEEMLRLID